MYIDVIIQDFDVTLLLDTGATVTIYTVIYNSMQSKRRSRLVRVHTNILTSNGEKLELIGHGYFSLQLENKSVNIFDLLAKINANGILGLNFMKAQSAVLDLRNEIPGMGDIKIQARYKSSMGCFRITTTEKVTIPAWSELIIQGNLAMTSESQTRWGDHSGRNRELPEK